MPKHKLGLLISLIAIIILLFYFETQSGIHIDKLQSFIRHLGVFAPIFFIFVYIFASMFFAPITPLSVTAGVLFGLISGTVYTIIGATLGACAAFLASKYLFKDLIEQKFPQKIALIQKRVEKEGWKFIAIARVNPVFPFNFQNYIFGVTNISLKTFFLATVFSIIPGAFTYVYLGYAGKSLLNCDSKSIYKIIAAIALLLFISLLPYMIKKATAKLRNLKV